MAKKSPAIVTMNWRVRANAKIGFVFQNFNLLPKLSAQLNVALPLVYAGIGEEERLERAKTALEAVGLGDRIDHNPTGNVRRSASACGYCTRTDQ